MPGGTAPDEREPETMTETTAPLAETFTPTAAEYAAVLIAAGFTVYADVRPTRPFPTRKASWFHYSQTVDGVECFGIYHDGSEGFDGAYHTMPLTPSRLNGSGAHIGAQWGDEATLGMDDFPIESVEMARAVARPTNWCPFNTEPTYEARMRADRGQSVPKRFYQGATLRNAGPSTIGTTYTPVSL
jgi:hypothetical protein